MTRAGSHVDELSFNISGHDAECLDCVHNEQRVVAACDLAESCENGTKPGGVLHVTDGDDTRSIVNQTFQLRQIDPAIVLLAHSHFHAKSVANAKPRIDVGRKLATQPDDIVARAPVESICDR